MSENLSCPPVNITALHKFILILMNASHGSTHDVIVQMKDWSLIIRLLVTVGLHFY